MFKIFNLKKDDKRMNIIYLVTCVVFLIFFYGYFYSDILITTSHGINFWDIIFSGRILDFHALCCSDVDNAAYTITTIYAGYDFPIYVLFGIWDFPLWVVRKLTGINIWECVPAMLWAKSIILFFTVLTIKSLSKICDTIGMPERKELVTIIFLSSSLVSSCAVVNSQYDIITSYFMLEALNCFLNRNRRGFVCYIAAAALVKPFSLFLFVPLILYAEKNAVKIGLYTLGVLAPYLGARLVIKNTTQLGTYSSILTLFKNKVHIGSSDIPIFILISFVLWIFCYMYRLPEEKESFYKNSIMISYLSFAVFFLFCSSTPYWCIMLLPFQCLLIGVNKKYELLNVIFETVGSICLIGHYIIEVPWCFDVRLLRTSFFPAFFGMRFDTTDNVLDIVHNISEGIYDMRDRGSSLLFGVFFVLNIVFIWLNLTEHRNTAFENEPVPRYLIIIRLLISLGVCLVPMTAYIL